MARNTEIPDPGVLIPISQVAIRAGVIYDIVWGKLDQVDVHRDWDGGYCVTWPKAKALFDEIHGANEAADRENARRINEQQDQEAAARRWPVTVYETLAKQERGPAVQVSLPGEDEGWAHDGTSTVVQP